MASTDASAGGSHDMSAAADRAATSEDMTGAAGPSLANLCAGHCQSRQQSDQAPTLTAPAALLTPLYATPVAPEPAAAPRSPFVPKTR